MERKMIPQITPENAGPELYLEEWATILSSYCGRHDVQGASSHEFSGYVKLRSICGLDAVELSGNPTCVERSHQDARREGIEFYCALIALGVPGTTVQNDRPVALGTGDIVLVDSARGVKHQFAEGPRGEWLSIHIPRRSLIAHLGSEPKGGLRAPHGTFAARLLTQLAQEARRDSGVSFAQSEPHMQFVIYDVLGALFAGTEPSPVSAHTDKLFARVCDVIRSCYTDPELGPPEVAAEVGVSLRYLQKLFTARGTTCTHFILTLRLDLAFRLVRRRNSMNTGQPLSQIAYACGFRDYHYFARAFRHRFGHTPGLAGTGP
jgi:AraC family transcriptional activator of tynA and feaB